MDNIMREVTSKKVLAFYDKHKHLDINIMNEMFVDMLERMYSSTSATMSSNDMRSMLEGISGKLDNLELKNDSWRDLSKKEFESLKRNYDYINSFMDKNKDLYLSEMRNLLDTKQESSLERIKEGMVSLMDQLCAKVSMQIPNGNEDIKKDMEAHKRVFELEAKKIMDTVRDVNDFNKISREIDLKYEKFHGKISESMFGMINQTNDMMMSKMMEQGHSLTNMSGILKEHVDKQKNSTLKGKESEIKLEMLLNVIYPNGKINNNTGEAQSADYLLEREGKVSILFENKDYTTNVPDVEIKKFVRDVENKKTHGIILSQRSGIQNKGDYHIDIHMGYVMVYVHNVNYDEAKIRLAVQVIDHLVPQLSKLNETEESSISLDVLAEINKEYLCFIGQKKQLLENMKKFSKDMMKQIEEIEMPKLTCLLNSKFTNVDQLEFKCDICGKSGFKNQRALVTHKNSCRKKMTVVNEVIVIQDDVNV